MDKFCDIIRKVRKEKGLLLREVAAKMGIDQAIVSKYERGERKPTKEQVLKFAKLYTLNKEELVINWLSDKVIAELDGQEYGIKAIQLAELKLKNMKVK